MEQSTKIALGIATTGLMTNQYLAHKQRTSSKGYLEQSEWNAKTLGAGAAILGYSSAAILHFTKDKPKARKIAFGTLILGTVGFCAMVVSAIKKFN
jgi:hypothetical protein